MTIPTVLPFGKKENGAGYLGDQQACVGLYGAL